MSSSSASYSETSSSGDESMERGEPSKLPEPKVVAPKWIPWAPQRNVPVAVVPPRQVAPMLPVGLLQLLPWRASSHGLMPRESSPTTCFRMVQWPPWQRKHRLSFVQEWLRLRGSFCTRCTDQHPPPTSTTQLYGLGPPPHGSLWQQRHSEHVGVQEDAWAVAGCLFSWDGHWCMFLFPTVTWVSHRGAAGPECWGLGTVPGEANQ